jgi:hypothetical protein
VTHRVTPSGILSQNQQAVADQGCHLEGSSLIRGPFKGYTVGSESSIQMQHSYCLEVITKAFSPITVSPDPAMGS